MQLQGSNVQGEYLFFAAYVQRGDEREMERVNGTVTPVSNPTIPYH
jgi:hypothetical protein